MAFFCFHNGVGSAVATFSTYAWNEGSISFLPVNAILNCEESILFHGVAKRPNAKILSVRIRINIESFEMMAAANAKRAMGHCICILSATKLIINLLNFSFSHLIGAKCSQQTDTRFTHSHTHTCGARQSSCDAQMAGTNISYWINFSFLSGACNWRMALSFAAFRPRIIVVVVNRK